MVVERRDVHLVLLTQILEWLTAGGRLAHRDFILYLLLVVVGGDFSLLMNIGEGIGRLIGPCRHCVRLKLEYFLLTVVLEGAVTVLNSALLLIFIVIVRE